MLLEKLVILYYYTANKAIDIANNTANMSDCYTPPVRVCVDVELEVLPVAPPPKPRELTEGEVDKIEKQREAVLRELRVFLRDATNKLLAERKFKEFAKPVDPEEVEVEVHLVCTHTLTHTCTCIHTYTLSEIYKCTHLV